MEREPKEDEPHLPSLVESQGHEYTQEEQPTLATKVREYREAFGLSQRALSRKAGLSHGCINAIERQARTGPRTETILKVAQALDLDSVVRIKLVRLVHPRYLQYRPEWRPAVLINPISVCPMK